MLCVAAPILSCSTAVLVSFDCIVSFSWIDRLLLWFKGLVYKTTVTSLYTTTVSYFYLTFSIPLGRT
jgi:hypothetical protein